MASRRALRPLRAADRWASSSAACDFRMPRICCFWSSESDRPSRRPGAGVCAARLAGEKARQGQGAGGDREGESAGSRRDAHVSFSCVPRHWTPRGPGGLRPGAKLRSVERKYVLKTPSRLKSLPRRLRPGAERRAARRRPRRGRAHPRHRGRRLRKDAHARLPRLPPDRVGPRPLAHPPADLHEQGRARDAPAGRVAPRRRHAAAGRRDVPLRRQPAPAAVRRAPGADVQLHDPRSRGRPRDARGRDVGPQDPDARAPVPQGRRAARSLLLHDQHRPPLHRGPRRARAALRRARDRDRLGLPALPRAQAAGQRRATTTTCCFSGSSLLDEVPAAAARARGPPSTTSSSTSTRTRTACRARSSTAWRRSRRT